MKISERILLIFVALLVVMLSVCAVFCLWNTQTFNTVIKMSYLTVTKISMSGLFIVLALLAVRIMFCGISQNNTSATLAATTNEGGIYINIDTISDLAVKAVKKVDGVKEVKVRSQMGDTGINIALKVSMAFDSVIPEVSSAVQQSVKSDIESLCGIKVERVSVQVDNSIQPQKN